MRFFWPSPNLAAFLMPPLWAMAHGSYAGWAFALLFFIAWLMKGYLVMLLMAFALMWTPFSWVQQRYPHWRQERYQQRQKAWIKFATAFWCLALGHFVAFQLRSDWAYHQILPLLEKPLEQDARVIEHFGYPVKLAVSRWQRSITFMPYGQRYVMEGDVQGVDALGQALTLRFHAEKQGSYWVMQEMVILQENQEPWIVIDAALQNADQSFLARLNAANLEEVLADMAHAHRQTAPLWIVRSVHHGDYLSIEKYGATCYQMEKIEGLLTHHARGYSQRDTCLLWEDIAEGARAYAQNEEPMHKTWAYTIERSDLPSALAQIGDTTLQIP